MKLSVFALLAVVSYASASKRPVLSIKVADGSHDSISGLDPTLSWSSSTEAGDIGVEYGIEASATPTSDIGSLPKNIWGKASTDLGAWGVSARAEFQGTDFSQADIEVDASDETSTIHVEAVAGSEGVTVGDVTATKTFDADGAEVVVTPRYNFDSGERDVVLSYSKDDTSIEVTASEENQSVTLSRQIDDVNRIAPTVTSDGAFSVEWEKSLDSGSLTTTVTPNEGLNFEWNDNSWTANIDIPMDGTDITGTTVSVKRDVSF